MIDHKREKALEDNNKKIDGNDNFFDEECDDYCDLDKTKICDSCGKCIETDKNYKIIKITKIIS